MRQEWATYWRDVDPYEDRTYRDAYFWRSDPAKRFRGSNTIHNVLLQDQRCEAFFSAPLASSSRARPTIARRRLANALDAFRRSTRSNLANFLL